MKTESLTNPKETKNLKAGRVVLAPGEEVGEHVTESREELLVVLNGTATLFKEEQSFELKEGETHFIKEGVRHNVKNNSGKELEYVYVVSFLAGPDK